ncbi:MAG: glycosyltransferase family 2 protein [Halofilum sp. (in: g-proteobacteria)]
MSDTPQPAQSPERVIAVIPAYNEGHSVAQVASEAAAHYPVIVVDDGSVDDTAAHLQALDLIVLRNESNQGKAYSLWRGFGHALEQGAHAVISLDADGQHAPDEIPRLIEAARAQPGALILAARQPGRDRAPPLRRCANRAADFWISWAAGQRIADTQSGFRLYPAELLRRVALPVDHRHGFVFESEVLIEAARLGTPIRTVRIEALYPPAVRGSHYRACVDTLRIVRMVAARLLAKGMYPAGLYRSLARRPP